MTIINKLEQIKKTGGFTQSNLAFRLQVSFQTINSWLTKKSTPRKIHLYKIERLYQQFFGLEFIDQKDLEEVKNKVLFYRDPNWVENILKSKEVLELLLLKITYHSNSIEGSTLTEADTEAILFRQKVLVNKTLIEQLEAINHQKAFYYSLKMVNKGPLKVEHILKIHKLLMSGIMDNAGEFRTHSVRILGSYVPTSNYLSIQKKLTELIQYCNETKIDSIEQIAKTHAIFEQIHPFSDGNGRVGRLLMVIMALKQGLPPVLVLQEEKQAYYKYLQQAQLHEEYGLLTYFVAHAMLKTIPNLE